MTDLNTSLQQRSVTTLKGVGPSMAEKLARLNIETVQDLLFHLPLRYQDRTRLTPIGALRPGSDAVIEGEVRACDIVFGRRRSLMCKIQDATGLVTLRFYYFNAAQKNILSPGNRVRCYGEVRNGSSGLELYHPEFKLITTNGSDAEPLTTVEETLTAIYPSSEGFQQGSWHKLTNAALNVLDSVELTEYLAVEQSTISLADALQYLHRPPPDADQEALREGVHPFQQRLVLEELLAHQLAALKMREEFQRHSAIAMPQQHPLIKSFLSTLAFSLTAAQQRVVNEIASDLSKGFPMLRLVQGDVGSGKTVVAALAALQVIGNSFQVALMAPTEILAEQHFQTFKEWFEPLGLTVGWLSGKVKGKKRQASLAAIVNNEFQIVIGTHALFQDEVVFASLGLAIIDEQHRFGVHQRLALKQKANAAQGHAHQLIMTATPIPRTLAMSAYADLDTSVIDELPPGRTPVQTIVIDNQRRDQIIERVFHACNEGRQVYWVCTLIEESESLQAQDAEATAQLLIDSLPNVRVGLVHGRLKPQEKAAIMKQYAEHEIDLLVATTVIEVGVNVPNASLMIIENAERLGLSQLHQLRGRVGRGAAVSHCVLMYQNPLSRNGKERLSIMRESNDGFYIAEQDLALRGPGEILGVRQTGLMNFKIADIVRDSELLPKARAMAAEISHGQPEVIEPIIRRWLPHGMIYGQV